MSQINGKAVNQFIMPFHCSRQLTGNVTGLFAFQLPFKCKAIEASVVARAKGGTITTAEVEVKEAGTTILSAAMDLDAVAAGVVVVGALADTSLADNAKMTVDVALAGTSPTLDDVTVALTLEKDD